MAHDYEVEVDWERDGQDFLDRQYSRAHVWRFDGGVEVPASSSPAIVKPPRSRLDAVDPEEALLASASSCHMLYFLDLAARAGFRIDSYIDRPVAKAGKRADGRTAIVALTIRPEITFSGETRPTAEDVAELHHRSHELCIIANSLNFEVGVEPAEPRFAG